MEVQLQVSGKLAHAGRRGEEKKHTARIVELAIDFKIKSSFQLIFDLLS